MGKASLVGYRGAHQSPNSKASKNHRWSDPLTCVNAFSVENSRNSHSRTLQESSNSNTPSTRNPLSVPSQNMPNDSATSLQFVTTPDNVMDKEPVPTPSSNLRPPSWYIYARVGWVALARCCRKGPPSKMHAYPQVQHASVPPSTSGDGNLARQKYSGNRSTQTVILFSQSKVEDIRSKRHA